MKEPVKIKFNWDDLEDPEVIFLCENCGWLEKYPTCDDGVTCSACNHCMFNIIDYCRSHDV